MNRNVILMIAVLTALLVGGCCVVGCETRANTMDDIVQLARTGNAEADLELELYGDAEAWQKLSFGIGNPHSRVVGRVKLRFSQPIDPAAPAPAATQPVAVNEDPGGGETP